MNKLYYGDNLEVLRKYIKDESVDLCYIDPPFNSKRNYNQIYNNVGSEDQAQAQAFIDTWTWDNAAEMGIQEITFNGGGGVRGRSVFTSQSIDLIVGLEKVLGRGSLLSYLVSMTLRIAEIYRVLKPTGSFYFHCDPTASHYLKLILDAVFCGHKGGEYRNEIIWSYPGREKKSNHSFQSKHDIIFFYSKTEGTKLNPITKKWDRQERIKMLRRKIHKGEDGREWFWETRGQANGVEPYKKDLEEYLEKGGALSDVWEDIQFLRGNHPERLGYPTQKPQELLERIITASSNEGDTVLDAYCGCGTTVSASEHLHRKWIGIDITYQSISLILKRLEDTFGEKILTSIELNGVPKDMKSAVALANKSDDKTRKEFEKWMVLTYSNNRAIINEKKGGDAGIDGIAYLIDLDKTNKQEIQKALFSVKSNKTLSPSVVRDLNGTMERDGAVAGFLLTLYPMENLVAESKKYGTYKNKLYAQSFPKIQVISVEEILQGVRLNLPTTIPVVKSAKKKVRSVKQHDLELRAIEKPQKLF